jgi:hypothetical protein
MLQQRLPQRQSCDGTSINGGSIGHCVIVRYVSIFVTITSHRFIFVNLIVVIIIIIIIIIIRSRAEVSKAERN